MLVVLPPSETKSPPAADGPPVDLGALSFPALTATRGRLLAALADTSARPDAFRRLLVRPSLADEVELNTRLPDVPARPVHEVYRGALHDALDIGTLSAAAARRAATDVVVVSALWGALRPADRIPPYRLHLCAHLVGVPRLEPTWREVLGPVLAGAAGDRGVVVELRSPSYVAAGRPAGMDGRTVTVRVLRDAVGRPGAAPQVAKRTRGELARHLLESGADPATPEDLAQVAAGRWPVELVRTSDARPSTLHLLVA